MIDKGFHFTKIWAGGKYLRSIADECLSLKVPDDISIMLSEWPAIRLFARDFELPKCDIGPPKVLARKAMTQMSGKKV